DRVVLIDRAPAELEGPWLRWARMRTLRSAKELHGPDAGHPAASFRRWYTAQHGESGWDALGLIPRDMWAAYLLWIRRVFGVTVRNNTEVVDVEADGARLVLKLREGKADAILTAKRLVICTGIDGIGGAWLPEFATQLNPTLWRHTSDELPLDELSGARVGVLGIGASALDNAATALEAGARVVQFARRQTLPTVNSVRSLETRGFFRHFDVLPDADRLEIARRNQALTVPPPKHSLDRCAEHDEYELRLGVAWTAVREVDGRAVVTLADGSEETFDLLIFGTGFKVDLAQVSWLRSLRPGISTWADTGLLGAHPADERIGKFPYLTRGMAATGRTAESKAWAGHVHFLDHAAVVSAGPAALGINGLPMATDHLVDELCRSLMREEAGRLTQAFYDTATEPAPTEDFVRV
ncbi:MAG: FAD-dependent oxidoreductase, partial [Leucobacter sp.]